MNIMCYLSIFTSCIVTLGIFILYYLRIYRVYKFYSLYEQYLNMRKIKTTHRRPTELTQMDRPQTLTYVKNIANRNTEKERKTTFISASTDLDISTMNRYTQRLTENFNGKDNEYRAQTTRTIVLESENGEQIIESSLSYLKTND